MPNHTQAAPKIPHEVALRLSLAEQYIKHVKRLIREDHTPQSRNVIHAIANAAHRCLADATTELAATDSFEKNVDFIRRLRAESKK